MELARITPVYKVKGCKNNPTNYRPISVISQIGKIMEKVVYKPLLCHFVENDLINPAQSAFLKNHSTETALNNMVDD